MEYTLDPIFGSYFSPKKRKMEAEKINKKGHCQLANAKKNYLCQTSFNFHSSKKLLGRDYNTFKLRNNKNNLDYLSRDAFY